MIPEGADAVVAFEETEGGAESERRVRFLTSAAAGLNVREAGRDVSEGEVVLAEGRELSAHDLALAASLGVPKLSVNRRPRAIVLSTGDELLEIDAAQRPGAIRDSNRLQLALLLEEAGASVVRTARLSDDPEKVRKGIASALSAADVVLTIGGVSAGDFDPVKQSLGELPEIALWRVAMKPGRPQAFGTPEGRMFFGLPGNPASVACTFEALVRPALRKLMGFSALDRPKLSVRSHARIDSREGRVDFVRVTLERRDGEWWASEAGEQVSGHLAPQSRAHALLVVPAECTGLDAGERGDALLLRWPESA
jgi:molybdopterin molybdotransferase